MQKQEALRRKAAGGSIPAIRPREALDKFADGIHFDIHGVTFAKGLERGEADGRWDQHQADDGEIALVLEAVDGERNAI